MVKTYRSKLAIVYTRDARNRDLCQVAVLWLWTHLLVACGLVSLVKVGWLAQD